MQIRLPTPCWYNPAKACSIFTDEDPSPQVAALFEAGGNVTKDPGTGASVDEDNKRKALRLDLDGRADERTPRAATVSAVTEETSDLIHKGRDYGIPESVLEDQVEDVGLIKQAHAAGKPMFLLANGAGTGKTFILGGAMREIDAQLAGGAELGSA